MYINTQGCERRISRSCNICMITLPLKSIRNSTNFQTKYYYKLIISGFKLRLSLSKYLRKLYFRFQMSFIQKIQYQIYSIYSPLYIQTSSQFSPNGKCLKTPILHLLPSTNGNKRKHFNFRSLLLCQKGGKVEEETSIGHHPSASTSSISSVSLWINVCRRLC